MRAAAKKYPWQGLATVRSNPDRLKIYSLTEPQQNNASGAAMPLPLPAWLTFKNDQLFTAYADPWNGPWSTPISDPSYQKSAPNYYQLLNPERNFISINDSNIADTTIQTGTGRDTVIAQPTFDDTSISNNHFTLKLDGGDDRFDFYRSTNSGALTIDNVYVMDGGNDIDSMRFANNTLNSFTKLGEETINGDSYYTFKDDQNNLFKVRNFEKVTYGGITDTSFIDFWNNMSATGGPVKKLIPSGPLPQ